MSKDIKLSSKKAHTDLVCVYREMVGNRVLMVTSNLRNWTKPPNRTYLDNLEELLWTVDAPDGEPV